MSDEKSLVAKACGWLLKDASRSKPQEVLHFVESAGNRMKAVVRSTALEKLPRSSVQVIDTEQQTEIMGAHLRPGGMHYLSPVPASEFAERDVPLECLWGAEARHLREQLIAGDTESLHRLAKSRE